MYIPKPFSIRYREDIKKYTITLNHTCGLPDRVCADWRRRSFSSFPDELHAFRNPKSDPAADRAAWALIAWLKKKNDEGTALRINAVDVTVGQWLIVFTRQEAESCVLDDFR